MLGCSRTLLLHRKAKTTQGELKEIEIEGDSAGNRVIARARGSVREGRDM